MRDFCSFVSLIATIVMFIIVILGIILLAPERIEENNNIIVEQEICEHDFMVSSKYDYIFDSYRTISKCSKCGKEI